MTVKYRIRQYPEDTFVVQYRRYFIWLNIKICCFSEWYDKKFSTLKNAQEEIDGQRNRDNELAFNPVYYDY